MAVMRGQFVSANNVPAHALQLVKKLFPDALNSILMARLASEAGSHGGLVTPCLLRLDDQRMRLEYLWNDADLYQTSE
jgi:hypothetical protein